MEIAIPRRGRSGSSGAPWWDWEIVEEKDEPLQSWETEGLLGRKILLRDVHRLVRCSILDMQENLRRDKDYRRGGGEHPYPVKRWHTAGLCAFDPRSGCIKGANEGRWKNWPIPGVRPAPPPPAGSMGDWDQEIGYIADVLIPYFYQVEKTVQRLISAHGARKPLAELLDEEFCEIEKSILRSGEPLEEEGRPEQTPSPDLADESLVAMLGLDGDGGQDGLSDAAGCESEDQASAAQSEDRLSEKETPGASLDPASGEASLGDLPESPVTETFPCPDGSQAGNPEEAGDLSLVDLLSDQAFDEEEAARLRSQAETLAEKLRPFVTAAMLAAEGDGDVMDGDELIVAPLTNPKNLCRELAGRSLRAARWRERERYDDNQKARAALVVLTDTSPSQEGVHELVVPFAQQLAGLTWPRKLADWRICHGLNGETSFEDYRWIQETAKKQGMVYMVYLGDSDGVGEVDQLASENVHVLALDNDGQVPKSHHLDPIPERDSDGVKWFHWE